MLASDLYRGTQRVISVNICSEGRSARIFEYSETFDFRFLNHRFPRYFAFSDKFPSYFVKFRNRTEEGYNFRKKGLKPKTVDGD